jgi:hypothetical protein
MLLGLIQPNKDFFSVHSDSLFVNHQFTFSITALWFLHQNETPNKYENWFKDETSRWCNDIKKHLEKRKKFIEEFYAQDHEKLIGIYFGKDCSVKIAKFSKPEVEN